MSDTIAETTSSEEEKNTTAHSATAESNDNKPVITVELAQKEPKDTTVDDNLQDDGAPDDHGDNEASQGKPEEEKTAQEKEDEAGDEPQKDVTHTNDKISKKALLAYFNGHFSIYMAVAWIYIFLFCVNKDKEYMKTKFDGRTNDITSEDYTKAINICLSLTDKQKSTASLYKGVLIFLDKYLSDTITITNDDKCAEIIANFIKDTGGLKVCQKKGTETGALVATPKKKSLSKNDYKRIQDDYLTNNNSVGGFTAKEITGFEKTDLIIMIARKTKGKTDEIEVVDMLTNEDLLKQIIRAQHSA